MPCGMASSWRELACHAESPLPRPCLQHRADESFSLEGFLFEPSRITRPLIHAHARTHARTHTQVKSADDSIPDGAQKFLCLSLLCQPAEESQLCTTPSASPSVLCRGSLTRGIDGTPSQPLPRDPCRFQYFLSSVWQGCPVPTPCDTLQKLHFTQLQHASDGKLMVMVCTNSH